MTSPLEQPPEHTVRTSRFAIAALVLGILSFLAGMLGMFTGLSGMALGFLALRHIKNDERIFGRKLAITGLAVSTLAVIFSGTIYDWNSLLHETPGQESHFNGPANLR